MTRGGRNKELLIAAAVLALAALSAPPPAVAAEPVSGRASVVDGNTLEVAGRRIALYGVDAPEPAQTCAVDGREVPCGAQAAAALAERIGQQTVVCKLKKGKQDGVAAAVCRAGEDDLGAWMVRHGRALAYRRVSTDYVREEKRAAKEKAGLWSGWFVMPWDWRRGRRLTRERVFEQNACAIKGNITRHGKRVYHVPGSHFYKGAHIEPSLGERFFCTEEEAREAGWRKSDR